MNTEPESQIEKSLREMYELGYEHGYQVAKRDAEIEQLTKELANSAAHPKDNTESSNHE